MNNTRKSLKAILTAACLLAIPIVSMADTVTNTVTNQVPTSPGSFLGTVVNYFSSFQTNYDTCFKDGRLGVWTGLDSIQNGAVPLANSLGLSYDIYHSTPSGNSPAFFFAQVENTLRTSGVQGTFLSDGAGLGAGFVIHDVKLTLYAEGVYCFAEEDNKLCAEVGVRVFKALTEHTYAGVGLAAQFTGGDGSKGIREILSAFVGFDW